MAKVVLSRDEVFIPRWNGNQEEELPITFHLRYLTTGERHRYAGQKALEAVLSQAAELVGDNKNGHRPEVQIDFEGMFRAAVTRIDNLEVEIDGQTTKVTTAPQLLELPGLNPLLMEVAFHISTANARQDPVP